MWTSSTKGRLGRYAGLVALVALMAGCATKPEGLDEAQGGESKYAEQRQGGAASDSDAVHVPPVPHDPSQEAAAQKALPEYVRALQTMKKGEHQKALIMLQSLSARFPGLSGPLVNQGIAHMALEEYEDAEDVLREALKVNEKNPYAHNSLGVALREQGKFEQALKHYRRALELDPKYARAHFNLGVLAELYEQDLPLALQHFRAYQNLQKEPDQNVSNWIADLERRVPEPVPPYSPAGGTGTAKEDSTDNPKDNNTADSAGEAS